MYLKHFGLSAPPFRITPHPEFFFDGAHRGEILTALLYAIQAGEGLMTVTGEVGSGKTMLCRVLADRLPANIDVVYLANPLLTPQELLLSIAEDLGAAFEENRTSGRVRQLQNLLVERFAAGRQVVVLIDEAHAMPKEALEEVRLLSNLDHGHSKLLQIVLFGQPELNERLQEPDLRQLRERITYRFVLDPLERKDVGNYIDWRLRAAGYTGASPFDRPALRLISRAAQGLTRRINILADKSMLAAYADGRHEVSSRQVRAAIKDSGFAPRHPLIQMGAIVLAACGIALVAWALQRPRPAPPVAAAIHAPAPVEMASPVVAVKIDPAPATASPVTAMPASTTAPVSHAGPVEASLRRLDAAPVGATALMLGAASAQYQDRMEALYAQLQKQLPPEQVLILPARLNGRPGWGVFYGFFPDRAAANKAMSRMPAELQKLRPFIRTAAGMKNELQAP